MKNKTKLMILISLLLIVITRNINAQSKYMLSCDAALLEKSLSIALCEVGTIEKSNKNDGDILKYLKPFGLKEGTQYCAAGQYYCFIKGCEALKLPISKIPIAKTALAQKIFNNAKLCGKQVKYEIQRHDLIVWKRGNTPYGHIERVLNVLQNGNVETIAFNTSTKIKGKTIEGVFIKKRNLLHPLGRLQIKGIVGLRNK